MHNPEKQRRRRDMRDDRSSREFLGKGKVRAETQEAEADIRQALYRHQQGMLELDSVEKMEPRPATQEEVISQQEDEMWESRKPQKYGKKRKKIEEREMLAQLDKDRTKSFGSDENDLKASDKRYLSEENRQRELEEADEASLEADRAKQEDKMWKKYEKDQANGSASSLSGIEDVLGETTKTGTQGNRVAAGGM